MTTVPEFRQNIMESLNYLDTVLPSGSTVVFVGLADGRVLVTIFEEFTNSGIYCTIERTQLVLLMKKFTTF
jgi:hypothetical protein